MAIIVRPPQERKSSHLILLGIFIFLLLIFLILVLRGNVGVVSIKPSPISPPQINFSNLDNPLLEELNPYPKPEEFTGILGREIPFLPAPTQPTPLLPF